MRIRFPLLPHGQKWWLEHAMGTTVRIKRGAFVGAMGRFGGAGKKCGYVLLDPHRPQQLLSIRYKDLEIL